MIILHWAIFIGGFLFGFYCGFATYDIMGREPKPTGPHCPACNAQGSKLEWDAAAIKLKRTCETCGCQVIQPPVYPDLFQKK